MSEQENVQIVKRAFEHLNQHNLAASEAFTAPDIQVEAPGTPTKMNRDEGRLYTQAFLDAFPDLRFNLRDLIAQGNKVVAMWEASGTHQNPMLTRSGDKLAPTQRVIHISGCTVYAIRDGKIVHQAVYWDRASLLTQIGVLQEASATH